MGSMVELKNNATHQHQIPGQHWGEGKPTSKIVEEGRMVDTDGEENESKREETEIFPMGGGEVKIPENMESLYAYVWAWCMEEEDNINLPYWNVVDEYLNPVEPTLLSANLEAVILEAASLLNYH